MNAPHGRERLKQHPGEGVADDERHVCRAEARSGGREVVRQAGGRVAGWEVRRDGRQPPVGEARITSVQYHGPHQAA